MEGVFDLVAKFSEVLCVNLINEVHGRFRKIGDMKNFAGGFIGDNVEGHVEVVCAHEFVEILFNIFKLYDVYPDIRIGVDIAMLYCVMVSPWFAVHYFIPNV